MQTEHGDVLILEDRKELAYNVGGVNYSLHPSPQYVSGQSITRGYAVSLGNAAYISGNNLPGAPGQLYYSVEGSLDKCIGISLSTVAGPSLWTGAIPASSTPVPSGVPGITVTTSYAGAVATYVLAGTSSGSGSIVLNGNTFNVLVGGVTAAAIVTSIVSASAGWPTTYSYSGSVVTLTVTSNSINTEVLDHGLYTWAPNLVMTTATGITVIKTVVDNVTTYSLQGNITNAVSGVITLNGIPQTFANSTSASTIATALGGLSTAGGYSYATGATGVFTVTTTVFSTGDLGNTVYVLSTSLPISSPASQFTTNRSAAAASGAPLIEVGICKSFNSMFIDFEGDTRGAANLSSVSAQAGEYLYAPGSGFSVPSDASGQPIAMTLTNPGMTGSGGTGTSFSQPFLASLGTDGNIYVGDRRKSAGGGVLNRNNITGFVSAGGTWPLTPGAIPPGTPLVIQKAGILSGFVGLTPGLAIYADINGGFTQNTANFSYYTDVLTPVGYAFTSTSIYVEIGFNTQTSDGNQIGSIIGQRNALPDAGYLTTTVPATAMNVVGTTTIASGPNAGTWDGTSLFGFIGANFGGAVQWTISGAVSAGQLFYINGIQYTVGGSTPAALATQIGAITQTGYTFTNPSSGVFGIANISGTVIYPSPTITFGSPFSAVFSISGGTYNLPASNIGTYIFTVIASGATGTNPSFYVNGVLTTVTGTNPSASTIAAFVGALTQTGYVFNYIGGNLFSIQNTNATYATPSVVLQGGSITNTVIPLTGGTPLMQIKYANFYQANPPQAPLFRYDSFWNQWGQLPSGVGVGSNISLGSSGSFLEFPMTSFGYDPPVTDLFVELYVSKGGLVRKIDPLPIVSGPNTYGYQVSKDIANYIKIEFAPQGLAYFDTAGIAGGSYVAIDSTWSYRFYIYRTQQYNKFYDYTQDQWFSQFKTLGLVGYTSSVANQFHGFMDRSTTAPVHTDRLNYDGDLYVTDEIISNTLTVGGVSTFNGNAKIVNSSLLLFNAAVQKYSVDLNGNSSQAGNLTLTSGSISSTDSSNILVFTTSSTGLNLSTVSGSVSKFSVNASGNIVNAGTLATSGVATFSNTINANGTILDSSSLTFNLFATPTTLNIGTSSAGVFNVNSATSSFQGAGQFIQGLLTIGANSVVQTQSSTLSWWKKGTTLVGASGVFDETLNTLNFWVTNGSIPVNRLTISSTDVLIGGVSIFTAMAQAALPPVGAVIRQGPGDASPASLYAGTTWTNVSYEEQGTTLRVGTNIVGKSLNPSLTPVQITITITSGVPSFGIISGGSVGAYPTSTTIPLILTGACTTQWVGTATTNSNGQITGVNTTTPGAGYLAGGSATGGSGANFVANVATTAAVILYDGVYRIAGTLLSHKHSLSNAAPNVVTNSAGSDGASNSSANYQYGSISTPSTDGVSGAALVSAENTMAHSPAIKWRRTA